MLAAGLATCASGGNHVLDVLGDIRAVLFKDHDTQGAVVRGNTRGSGHRGVKPRIDEVLHHGVEGWTIEEAHGHRADASAVPGVVLWWENNPVVQFELTEFYPEIIQGTVTCREFRARKKLRQVDVQDFIPSFALWGFSLPSPLLAWRLFWFKNHRLWKCVWCSGWPLISYGTEPLVGSFAGVIEVKEQRRGPQGELQWAFAPITSRSLFLRAGDVEEQVYSLLLQL